MRLEDSLRIHQASHLNMNADRIKAQAVKDRGTYQATLEARERIKIELMCKYRIVDDFTPEQPQDAEQIALPDTRIPISQAKFDCLLAKKLDEFETEQIQKAWSENRENIKTFRKSFTSGAKWFSI